MSETNEIKNIFLIGYRGAGKSTVADILCAKTGKRVVHMDEELTKEIGDISKFVKENSWEKFREIESRLLKKISVREDIIIDCGGGIVERDGNINLIRKSGIGIFLKADIRALEKRILGDKKNLNKRPSLTGKKVTDEIEKVMESRLSLYKKAASIEIDTETHNPEEIANLILWELSALPRIAVCISADITADAINKIKDARKYAKLIEVRIDSIKDMNENNLKKIIDSSEVKLIVTNRPSWEGGNFSGDEKARLLLLEKAISFGATFVDIELNSRKVPYFVKIKKESKIICSYHDFEKIPDDIEELFEKMRKTNADIIKIACFGNNKSDEQKLNSLREMAKKEGVCAIIIMMGINGKMSRTLNMLSECDVSGYAATDDGKKTAPGQLTLEEMKKIYIKVR